MEGGDQAVSKTVDERVVKMQFDNQQFEQGVKTTMSSLDKFKQALKLDGATKGLENVDAAAKKVNMSGLGDSIEAVRLKFSALEVMGVTALSNITNEALNAGKKVVKAFTIDPVKSGFQEYETQINAVQTILANTSSKGTTLDQVNNALDELNHYADLTIYNFTEMTRNIGTFTAAGVDLDTSVQAIKGIANLAAVSGSTSQQASTAMYQLSQALAAGTVKLQDWNSVVNAGMGGQVFQDSLKETARVHGIAIDEMIEKEGSFRETLSKGWLSSEVLTETLSKFTGDLSEAELKNIGYTDEQIKAIMKMGQTANDAATKVKTFTQLKDTLMEAAQSGWTQTWELLVGDFEEAKTFYTELSDTFSDIIGKSADNRNKLLEGALGSTGWTDLTKKVEKAGITVEDFQNGLIETAKKHGIAIDDMIKKEGSFSATLKNGWLTSGMVAETLKNFISGATGVSNATENMTDKLSEFQDVVNKVIRGDFGNGETRMKKLADAGYDYAQIQGMVNDVLAGGSIEIDKMSDAQLKSVGYTDEQIKAIKELADQAEKTGTPINKLIDDMTRPSGRELLIDSLRNSLKAVMIVCKSVKGAWRDVFPKTTSEQLYKLIERTHEFSKWLIMSDDYAKKLRNTFKGIFSVLKVGLGVIGSVIRIGAKLISIILKPLGSGLLTVTSYLGKSTDALVSFGEKGLKFVSKEFGKFKKEIEETKAAQWVIKNAGDAMMLFGDAADYVKEHIGNFNLGDMDSNFKSIEKYADKAGTFIQNKYHDVLNALDSNEFTQPIFENLTNSMSLLKSALDGFKVPSFYDLLEEIEKLQDYLNKNGYLENGVETMVGTIKYFKDIVFTKAGNIKDTVFGVVESWAKSGLSTVKLIGNTLKDTGEKTKEAKTNIENALISLKEFIKSAAGKISISDIIETGKGIATIGILYQFYKILEKFANTPTLMQGVNSTLKEFRNTLKSYQTEIKSKAFKDIGIAVALISASIVALAQLDWKEAWKSAAAVGGIIALLVTAQIALSQLGNGAGEVKMAGFAMNIIALSGGLFILSKAIEGLMGVKWSEIVDGLKVMGSMLAGLTIAGMGLSAVNGKIGASSITLLALVVALDKLIAVLKHYSELNFNELQDGIKILGEVAAGMAAFLAIVGLFTKNSSLVGAAVTIGALVASLYLLTDVIDKYKGLSMDETTIGTLVAFAGGLLLFTAVLGECGNGLSKSIGTVSIMLAFVYSLNIMADVFDSVQKKLSKLSDGQILATLAVMVTMLGTLALAIGTVSKMSENAKSGTIVALAASLLVLVGAVVVFGNLDTKTVIQGVATVSVLLLALGGALRLGKEFDTKSIAGIVAMLTSLAVFIAGIKILESVDLGRILVSAVALGGIMLALAGAMKLANGSSFAGAAGIAVMAVGILALAAALKMLDSVNLPKMIANIVLLAVAILGLIGAAMVMEPLAGGVAVLIAALLTLSVTMIAFGAGALLFANSLQVSANALPGLTDGLVYLVTSLAGCKDVIADFSSVMLQFGYSAMNVLAEIGVGLVAFSVGLVVAGVGLVALVPGVLGLGAGLLIVAGAVGIAAAGIYTIAASFKMGADAVGTMGNNLPILSAGMTMFVNTCAACSDKMSNVKDTLVAFGTSVEKMLGEIGSGMLKFAGGAGVAALSITVLAVSLTALGVVGIAFTAAIPFLAMNMALLNSTFDSTAKSVKNLAVAFADAMLIIAAVFTGNIEALKSAGSNVAKGFAEGMDSGSKDVEQSSAGLAAKVVSVICSVLGIHSPSIVAKALGAFTGEGFALGLDDSQGKVGESASNLGNISIESLTNSGVFKQLGLDSGTDFAAGLTGSGSKVSDATGNLQNISLDSLGDSSTFKGLGLDSGTSFASGLSEGAGNNKSLNNAMDAMLDKSANSKESFKKSGNDLMTSFTSGVSNKKTDAVHSITTILTAMRNAARAEYNSFRSAGVYLVEGFAKGIKESNYKAAAKAKEMAKSASDAAKKQLDEHSPSKVFYKIGDFAGQGFVNGLDEYAKVSHNAGARMGVEAQKGLGSSISKIVDTMNDMDFDPTIRPVMDLSRIHAGISEMSRIMPNGETFQVGANVEAISSNMQNRQNGVNNADVIRAIDRLGQKLDGRSGDSYTIDGVTYDDGSNIAKAVNTLTREIKVRRRM